MQTLEHKKLDIVERYAEFKMPTEVIEMMSRLDCVDVNHELTDLLPLDQWFRGLCDDRRKTWLEDRHADILGFANYPTNKKPVYLWTDQEIQSHAMIAAANEGDDVAHRFLLSAERQRQPPNFEQLTLQTLGERLEVNALVSRGGIPPGVSIDPLPNSFRIELAKSALGWNGESMDSVGMFDVMVSTATAVFQPVPMRAAILFYCTATKPKVTAIWNHWVQHINWTTAPKGFLPVDMEAAMEAMQLIQQMPPLDVNALPDFALYKFRIDAGGRIITMKEHEDENWVALKLFVLQMDEAARKGAMAHLSPEIQAECEKRRAYVMKIVKMMEFEAGTVVCEPVEFEASAKRKRCHANA